MIGIDHAFAASRTNIVQNIPYLDSFFSECVESTVFCDGSTRGLKKYRKYWFITSSSQSKSAKNTGPCSVFTRQNVKNNRIFWNNFSFFVQLVPLNSIQTSIFGFVFAIRTRQGVKLQHIIAVLHLKCSQLLRRSSTSKNWGGCLGPKTL